MRLMRVEIVVDVVQRGCLIGAYKLVHFGKTRNKTPINDVPYVLFDYLVLV
jgi:hypothetical protein